MNRFKLVLILVLSLGFSLNGMNQAEPKGSINSDISGGTTGPFSSVPSASSSPIDKKGHVSNKSSLGKQTPELAAVKLATEASLLFSPPTHYDHELGSQTLPEESRGIPQSPVPTQSLAPYTSLEEKSKADSLFLSRVPEIKPVPTRAEGMVSIVSSPPSISMGDVVAHQSSRRYAQKAASMCTKISTGVVYLANCCRSKRPSLYDEEKAPIVNSEPRIDYSGGNQGENLAQEKAYLEKLKLDKDRVKNKIRALNIDIMQEEISALNAQLARLEEIIKK